MDLPPMTLKQEAEKLYRLLRLHRALTQQGSVRLASLNREMVDSSIEQLMLVASTSAALSARRSKGLQLIASSVNSTPARLRKRASKVLPGESPLFDYNALRRKDGQLARFLTGLRLIWDDGTRKSAESLRASESGPLEDDAWQHAVLGIARCLRKLANTPFKFNDLSQPDSHVSRALSELRQAIGRWDATVHPRSPFLRELLDRADGLEHALKRRSKHAHPGELADNLEGIVRGTLPELPGPEQPWVDSAPGYVSGTAAVELSNGRVNRSRLTRLTFPGGGIRYMRRGHKLQVHLEDFMKHLTSLPSDKKLTRVALKFLDDADAERAAVQESKRLKH